MTPSERVKQSENEDSLREQLIVALREQSGTLRGLLAKVDSHWGMEDEVYRFYHQSFKVYYAQEITLEMVKALQALLPGRPLNAWFVQIMSEGTGKMFEMAHNDDWLRQTRPMIEALFHARYFLSMACAYAEKFEKSPSVLPSGFAALLYLFDLR